MSPSSLASPFFRWSGRADLSALLAFLAPRCLIGLDHADPDVSDPPRALGYRRLARLRDKAIVLSLRTDPAHQRYDLDITGLQDPPGGRDLEGELRRRTDHFLDLEQPANLWSHLGQDSVLKGVLAETHYVRLPGAWDPFEMMVRAILGQQVTVKAARTLTIRLLDRCAPEVPMAPPPLTRLFPRPADLVRADLDAMGVTGARIACLRGTAEAALKDPGLFDPLDQRDWVERRAQLLALKGIGPWTVDYLGLRAFGVPDAFPIGDAGLIRAVGHLIGHKPTKKELEAISEPWRPYRSYAVMALWTWLAKMENA
ncbi:MAG: DNA-3-methyladenine glycosylase family protein [Rhodospirillaceae bacterium]